MIRTALALTMAALLAPLDVAAVAEEIRFNRGETSATVRGEVSAFIKSYTFRARAGQTISVSLEPVGGDRGMVALEMSAFCGEQYGTPLFFDKVLRWKGALPCNGNYGIDVTPSEAARAEKRVQRYALTITIR